MILKSHLFRLSIASCSKWKGAGPRFILDFQLSLDRKAADHKIALLQEQFDSEKISQEQFTQQRRIILKDQAQKEKEAAIIKATISTAEAVISAFADGGPVLAAIAGALGLAQIAIISATPIPEFTEKIKVFGSKTKKVTTTGTYKWRKGRKNKIYVIFFTTGGKKPRRSAGGKKRKYF